VAGKASRGSTDRSDQAGHGPGRVGVEDQAPSPGALRDNPTLLERPAQWNSSCDLRWHSPISMGLAFGPRFASNRVASVSNR